MLSNEDDIKEYANISQCQFDRVSSDSRPVSLPIAVCCKLHEREYTPNKIEEYLQYGPAFCRVVSVVREDLRHVFYKCDDNFYV